MAKLKPVFRKDGTITAGNASAITDGAAALVVLSEDAAARHGVTPQAALLGAVSVGVDPARMGLGPVPAVRQLLERHRLTLADIDVIELNEAFAAQVIACDRELKLRPRAAQRERRRHRAGPPHRLQRRAHRGDAAARTGTAAASRYGIATLCVSGGQGMAVLVERM